jgi:uracil-DNA glycosylase
MNGSSLSMLSMDIAACRVCVEKPIGKPLPHEPRPVCVMSSNAKIAICGQAPGNRVNQSGIPFTDPSGDRLRDWLEVDSQTFYDPECFAIVPMGFCFPGNDGRGGDLPPRRECAMTWHDRVFAVMPQLELKLLVGASAQAWHLGSKAKGNLTQTVANWREYLEGKSERGRAVACLPLPHPSWRNNGWITKNPWFDNELLPELRELIQKLLVAPNGKTD